MPNTTVRPSALRWTCKSVRDLARELNNEGISVGHQSVALQLHALGCTLQSNRKCVTDGGQHPDRNARFEYINARAAQDLKKGNPVISVDTKNKELAGNYKNAGKQRHEKKNPVKVKDHDFPGSDIPRAHPYGIYDMKRNGGFVNVGSDHDTAQFVAASIRVWRLKVGETAYPGQNAYR